MHEQPVKLVSYYYLQVFLFQTEKKDLYLCWEKLLSSSPFLLRFHSNGFSWEYSFLVSPITGQCSAGNILPSFCSANSPYPWGVGESKSCPGRSTSPRSISNLFSSVLSCLLFGTDRFSVLAAIYNWITWFFLTFYGM